MKSQSIKIALIMLFTSLHIGYSQDNHVRIGFFGNSITYGSGLAKPSEESYPSQIRELLAQKYGDTCIVENFAVSGTTMLKKGNSPLWSTDPFKNGLNYAPDLCFISLGTNDTKPRNWETHGKEFFSDYLAMIDTLKSRNPRAKFIVCYPAPAFAEVWHIRNSVIIDGIIPNIDSILTQREATLVDFYNPLVDSVALFPDKIHPNASGAKAMAKIAYNKIVESDIIHKILVGRQLQ